MQTKGSSKAVIGLVSGYGSAHAMCCRSEVKQTSWVIGLSVPHQAPPTASINFLGNAPVGVAAEGKSAFNAMSGV